MTEADWQACDDPRPMLARLGGAASVRKRRLLGVAGCGRFADVLYHDLRRALHAAEAWADGGCGPADRKDARRAAHAAAVRASGGSLADGLELSDSAAWAAQELLHRGPPDIAHLLVALADARLKEAGARAGLAGTPRDIADGQRAAALAGERRAQCDLVRDIFGNPYRPVAFSPQWRTGTALALARRVYEARDFGALPILADALQDAGCDSGELLDHLRGPGPHVKGCWALDLVLGRE